MKVIVTLTVPDYPDWQSVFVLTDIGKPLTIYEVKYDPPSNT